MKKKYRFSPPGISMVANICMLILAALFFLIIISSIVISSVYYSNPFEYKLMDSLSGAFAGFWVYAAVCVALIVRNYHSFRTSSQSIYTMKRISDPASIHIMCLTVPVIGLIAGLALSIGIMYLYRNRFMVIYSRNLPEAFELDIWRALTW